MHYCVNDFNVYIHWLEVLASVAKALLMQQLEKYVKRLVVKDQIFKVLNLIL